MTQFTVVIPTYNRANTVSMAIDSVLKQSHAAAEIIVVNDGSTDNTQEVLAKYRGAIRAIHQENGGPSGSRNTGIKEASHEWVAFLDDDDEYTPERLAIAAESIRRFPKADVHASNIAIISAGSDPVDLFKIRGLNIAEWTPLQHPITWILKGCFFVQSCVVRRTALTTVGMFRKTFYEDLDLLVRLAPNPWIVDARRSLHLIRRDTGTNVSTEWRSRPVQRCEALVSIHREALKIQNLTVPEQRAVRNGLATYLFELGTALSTQSDGKYAKKCFAEAAQEYTALHSRLKAYLAYAGAGRLITFGQKLRMRHSVIR